MVTLEMVLDASGIQRGAREAERSLDGVGGAASRVGKSLDEIGTRAQRAAQGVNRLGDAFQSVGGSIQVGQGLQATLAALERADVAQAGFQTSRTLLEIAKTGADFRQLAQGVGATGGAFATLGAIMRAHPILTIATAIGIAATAIGVFTSETEKSTQAVERQASALDRMRQSLAEVQTRARFSGVDPRTTTGGAVDALTAMSLSGNGRFQVGDAARLLGVSESELRALLGRAGAGESAAEILPGRQRDFVTGSRYRVSEFDRDTTLRAGELLLQQRRQSEALSAFQRGAPQPNLDAVKPAFEKGDFFGPTDSDWIKEQQRRAEESTNQYEDRLRELQQTGAEVGATLGKIFMDAAAGATTARQAVMQLIQSLGSMFAQRAFSALGSAVGGAFAGPGPRSGEPPATSRGGVPV